MKKLWIVLIALLILSLTPGTIAYGGGEEKTGGWASSPPPSQDMRISYSNTNIISSLSFKETPQTPPIYIQYHVWFTKGSCPSADPQADWWHWSWSPDHNPCETPFPQAPWLRELSSPGYPLIGLYDSSNDEVLRWHIRLAKAAGVSGFFVSVYSFCPPSCTVEREFFRSNFSRMLDIAKEENFYLGIEDWYPFIDLTDTEPWKAEVQNQIDTFGSHPAFLRINGKPAIWFNFYLQWMNLDELTQFLDSRSAFWIVGGITLDQLRAFKQKSTQAEATQPLTYNVPTTSGWSFVTPDFESQLLNLADEGFVSIAHGYPGFDERAVPDREERRFGLRNNGQILNDFLSASVGGKAQAVILESFNDFAEYTQFEPGFDIKQYRDTGQEVIYSGDPYRYLEILADFKGVSWVTPMPPCSIVDSSLLQHNMVQCAPTPTPTPMPTPVSTPAVSIPTPSPTPAAGLGTGPWIGMGIGIFLAIVLVIGLSIWLVRQQSGKPRA